MPALLIFREGQRTEEIYLTEWWRRHRDRIRVTIDDRPAGPLQLVERAVAEKQHELREARRGRGRPHDEIWCIFDRDEHPNFDEAVALAATHGINIAISNPCIELWFLLHFENHTAFLDRAAAQRKAAALLGCEKVLSESALDALITRHLDAADRAQRLDAKHAGDGSPPGSNPSSSVWRLIAAIRRA